MSCVLIVNLEGEVLYSQTDGNQHEWVFAWHAASACNRNAEILKDDPEPMRICDEIHRGLGMLIRPGLSIGIGLHSAHSVGKSLPRKMRALMRNEPAQGLCSATWHFIKWSETLNRQTKERRIAKLRENKPIGYHSELQHEGEPMQGERGKILKISSL